MFFFNMDDVTNNLKTILIETYKLKLAETSSGSKEYASSNLSFSKDVYDQRLKGFDISSLFENVL